LGKEYANALNAALVNQAQPLILLGGDQRLSPGINRLTLSPERDAYTVADKAFAEGYVTAAVLSTDNKIGQRTANAFKQYWLAKGGKLSRSITYSPTQFDHTTELKQLFDINQSEYRFRQISKTLAYKPKYASYRRSDIDFVFLIADNNTGRIVRPQITFFGGSDVPVLASPSIYNGIQDETNNMDLNNTSFPVLPWILISQEVAPYAGQLNMLFALGADAYSLAANLRALRADSSLSIEGNMGLLSVKSSGEVIGQPIWADFKQGLAQTQAQLNYLLAPEPDNSEQDVQNDTDQGIPTYNESNWDTRQSRRKSGT